MCVEDCFCWSLVFACDWWGGVLCSVLVLYYFTMDTILFLRNRLCSAGGDVDFRFGDDGFGSIRLGDLYISFLYDLGGGE